MHTPTQKIVIYSKSIFWEPTKWRYDYKYLNHIAHRTMFQYAMTVAITIREKLKHWKRNIQEIRGRDEILRRLLKTSLNSKIFCEDIQKIITVFKYYELQKFCRDVWPIKDRSMSLPQVIWNTNHQGKLKCPSTVIRGTMQWVTAL